MLTALGSGIYSPSGPLNFENISGYSRAPLVSGRQENLTLCHGETFCCQASYYLLGDSYHLWDRHPIWEQLRPARILWQTDPFIVDEVRPCDDLT